MISNKYQIETPEGIDIDLIPAGLAARTYAFCVDFSIRIGIVIACSIIFSFLGDFGSGLIFITIFVVEWFYPVLFEIYKGATPGKKAFSLRVVYDNGLPISFAGSLTRNLFRTVDFLPFCYVIGAVSIILNTQNKRLGDIIAGTTVVYAYSDNSHLDFNFDKEPVDIPAMTTQQQQLVVAFALRSKDLSVARQIELASVLSEVVNAKGEEAITKIKSIAAIIIGKS